MDAGEQGEICIKGPLCSPGYIHYSGTDTRAEELYDADGFLRTGEDRSDYSFRIFGFVKIGLQPNPQNTGAQTQERCQTHFEVGENVKQENECGTEELHSLG